MNQSKTGTKGTATAAAGPKRYEEVFKRQAAEHWLRRGRRGTLGKAMRRELVE